MPQSPVPTSPVASTTASSADSVDPAGPAGPVGSIGSDSAISHRPGPLDRWPFRRKLNVLVVVPILVVAAMLAYIAHDQIGQARSAADAARLARDSQAVTQLIDAVQTEHRQALLVALRYEAAGQTPGQAPTEGAERPDTTAYLAAQEIVDQQQQRVRAAFGDRLPVPEADALREISGLDSLRESIAAGPIPADNIDPAYGAAVDDLIDGLGLGRPSATASAPAGTSGNLLDALLRATTAHAAFETSVFAARTGDPNALIEYNGAVGDYEQYTYQADRFTRLATRQQGSELAEIERSTYESVIAQHYASLQVDPSGLVAETPTQVRAALDDALRDDPTYAHQADNRLRITESLIHQIAADTQNASVAAWWRAAWLLAGALVLFAAWLLFSFLARRSVLRVLRALTGAAKRVADATGQELARVAEDDDAAARPPRLEAVPVPVRDEIGELAEAFNQVQVTATAMLERQITSRRNIAEMFGNVGRRVSNLTARQLGLIDSVERGETDAAVLERLYRIDHIAVRLQRNADSLMLLAGIRDSGLDAGPARLSNVVRAALGQIEAYQRVTPRAEGDVSVSPDVIGDLTLMLAELLENAVTFSPASSRVEVRLRPLGTASGPVPPSAGPDGRQDPGSSGPPAHGEAVMADGAVVEIVDHGLGMSTERLAEENARLVRRERLDLVPTKVLGLFVVGSISRRWGIGVTLARTSGGGVTATVSIPAAHLLRTAPARPARSVPPQRSGDDSGERRNTTSPPRRSPAERRPSGPADTSSHSLPRRSPARPADAQEDTASREGTSGPERAPGPQYEGYQRRGAFSYGRQRDDSPAGEGPYNRQRDDAPADGSGYDPLDDLFAVRDAHAERDGARPGQDPYTERDGFFGARAPYAGQDGLFTPRDDLSRQDGLSTAQDARSEREGLFTARDPHAPQDDALPGRESYTAPGSYGRASRPDAPGDPAPHQEPGAYQEPAPGQEPGAYLDHRQRSADEALPGHRPRPADGPPPHGAAAPDSAQELGPRAAALARYRRFAAPRPDGADGAEALAPPAPGVPYDAPRVAGPRTPRDCELPTARGAEPGAERGAGPPVPRDGASRTQVPGARSPRPLRRRIRGATLSATTASGILSPRPDPEGSFAWHPADAEATRSELDEFEAAVARAERDSAHPPTPPSPYPPGGEPYPYPPGREPYPPGREQHAPGGLSWPPGADRTTGTAFDDGPTGAVGPTDRTDPSGATRRTGPAHQPYPHGTSDATRPAPPSSSSSEGVNQ